jgi:hypothetical protein
MEINAEIPGACNFKLVPDEKLNKKYNSNSFHKPKVTFDKDNPEHQLAIIYKKALEDSMMLGMQETFDIVGSDIPAGATCEVSKFWVH